MDSEVTYSSKLNIAWSAGEWRFTMLNQPTIKIKAGRRECLGLSGGKLFLFTKMKICIDDVKIDFEGFRRIVFHGSCSSIKSPNLVQFESSIWALNETMLLMTKSSVRNRRAGDGGR